MTAAHTGFGDDPFIMPVDPNYTSGGLSAWAYAKARCNNRWRTLQMREGAHSNARIGLRGDDAIAASVFGPIQCLVNTSQ